MTIIKRLSITLFTLGLSTSLAYASNNLTQASTTKLCHQHRANADLMQVLHDALQCDPNYKQAQAEFLADREALSQAWSVVKPQFDISATAGRSWDWQKNSGNYAGTDGANFAADTSIDSAGYELQLSQAIFNWQAFAAIGAAKNSVKQAMATYADARQSLILRVASSYFNVLQTQENLRTSEQNLETLRNQLNVASQRYKVGLDPITQKYQAQASYDSARAVYIANKNEVAIANEDLRVITGRLYDNLAQLETNFKLFRPTPENIDVWEKTAINNNLAFKASRFAALSAEQNITANEAERYPNLGLTGQFGQTWNDRKISPVGAPTNDGQQRDTQATVGLALDFKPYQGGRISSDVRTAEAQFKNAVAGMDLAYRSAVAGVRKAYLSVISGISQLDADRRAIESAEASLRSTRAGYKVGTETINDVLLAQQALFQAQTAYTKDRFDYLNETLALKQQAGMLNEFDLDAINKRLLIHQHTKPTQPKAQSTSASPTTTKKITTNNTAANTTNSTANANKPVASPNNGFTRPALRRPN